MSGNPVIKPTDTADRPDRRYVSHNNRWSRANLGFHLCHNALFRWNPVDLSSIPTAPVVIGAIGGSGTRIIGQVLQLAGYWMGAWVNPSTQDAMATRHFLQQRFEDILRESNAGDARLDVAFRRAIGAHRWGIPDSRVPWGWKNPRNIWVISYLARKFPGMKFVHLVRDGRDIALSSNRNLLNKHGDFLLPGQNWRANPVRANLDLWVMANRQAQELGPRLLGDRYLALRYEDLCTQPRQALASLFEFLALPPELEPAARSVIQPSVGISRWKASGDPTLFDPGPQAEEVLGMFGYT